MADDDEIDVLGDYNLGNLLSKNDSIGYEGTSLISQNGDLLNCDYTIHPQWLLDRPSANPDNWYDTNKSTGLNEKASTENDTLGHVSTENCITDESGWTEKEKNLLERGIDIFGKSNIRLSQFIGSKTAPEVKYYLKNFYLENHGNIGINEGNIEDVTNANLVADVLDDNQIPASIEEVIAAVGTAKPTIYTNSQRPRKKSTSFSYKKDTSVLEYKDDLNGHSVSNSSYVSSTLENSCKQSIRKFKKCGKMPKINKERTVKFKFKTTLKEPDPKENENILKHKIVKVMNELNKKAEFSKVEITTGRGLAVPICEGEEIVKLKKVDDSDTDAEIDVELSEEDIKPEPQNLLTEELTTSQNQFIELKDSKASDEKLKETNKNDIEIKQPPDLSLLDQETLKQLTSLEKPKCELLLSPHHITELEKVIHNDYFEGRSSKTPARYLKIRNHILNVWLAQKPNYLKKTSSRQGLKNCGDVNCFGRIHQFLEQIGAINFGCEQVAYSRPLSEMIYLQSLPREKCSKDKKNIIRPVGGIGVRQRNKKKFMNDGEGGCTLTHDEKGHVINTTIVSEEPIVKQRLYIKKPTIRLIYCRPFMAEKPQPYTIKIHLSTILTMDFHAHLSLTEVMGLVAGYWVPQNNTLLITHYEPCLNIAPSATHCDMCPISQARAADAIHCMELDILGWFHSHPTFAPEPSQQDLETQQTVQQWIGHKRPCIGVILSPFSLNGALIASPFRCMVVDKKVNFGDQFVPYKFEVDVVSEGFVAKDFLMDLKKVLRFDIGCGKVDFGKPYFLDSSISYLEKYITSVRMRLAKCGTLNRTTCDCVIQGITDIINASVQ